MYYSLEEAQKLIIEAGHKLLEKGLTARTWGNISARISFTEFLITPSGRAYEDLTPDELVIVQVHDASYEEGKKPSSEKAFHSAIYKLREDASFIIHTHQFFASAISVNGENYDFAPCCAYGLPGTEALKKAVAQAVIDNKNQKSFLLKNHGALCIGDSYEESFALIDELEENSKALFKEKTDGYFAAGLDYNDYTLAVFISVAKNINRTLRPYIDDFAQFFGPSVDLSEGEEKLCVGEDSEAMKMVLIKNCAAAIYASRVGAKPLGSFDSFLQRMVYKFKYSKLKNK